VKYVITDRGEVAVGTSYHKLLAEPLAGTVIAAGHYRLINGGRWVEVYGRSSGFGIAAKPEDAVIVARHIGL
jgi:hypothetical protein